MEHGNRPGGYHTAQAAPNNVVKTGVVKTGVVKTGVVKTGVVKTREK